MKYFDELQRSMTWLAEQPKTLFIGQAVGVPGTFMFNTLKGVPQEKRIELPVCESFQMQLTLGLALGGVIPVSIYPRQNFLMLAFGDLVNMIDKIPDISSGKASFKLLIRSAVGPDKPVHPGHQHIGDYTEVFQKALPNVKVTLLEEPSEIFPAYRAAFEDNSGQSHILFEVGNYYNDK